MTTGTISTSASPPLLVAPNQRVPFVGKDSQLLTPPGMQQLQQTNQFINATSRMIPCSCTGTANALILTPVSGGPLIGGYFDYETYSAVAASSSSGAVTATVVPQTGTLAALKVFKTNGSAQAGAGDLTAGLHYLFTYVDSLDSGNGGFVLR